jgi:BMFP domain-containing protein YqiC
MPKLCVISGCRRDVDEICALLGYYAVSSGISVPTFRDNLSALSSRVLTLEDRADRTATQGSVICQKSSALTFRDNLSVPSSRVKTLEDRADRTATQGSVICQKSSASTFRDNLSVPSSRVKTLEDDGTDRTTTEGCVIYQKSANLVIQPLPSMLLLFRTLDPLPFSVNAL